MGEKVWSIVEIAELRPEEGSDSLRGVVEFILSDEKGLLMLYNVVGDGWRWWVN